MDNVLIANIFSMLVLFSILMFVFFDGITIGIGLIFPFITRKERSIAMATIHPFWDVNETWLIMAAVFLVTGFNHAYSVFISECYVPVVILLGALTFRIGALEFTHKYEKHHTFWHWAFFKSCLVIALILGVFVGNLTLGFSDSDGFFGKILRLFTLVPILSGILSVLTFALIGAMWLILKTQDVVQSDAKRIAKWIIKLLFIFSLLGLGLALYKFNPYEFSFVKRMIFGCAGGLFFVFLANTWFCIRSNKEKFGLFSAYGLVVCGAAMLLSITYPYVVPYKYTIHDALRFTVDVVDYGNILVVLGVLLVIVMIYFIKNYRVFKGKFTREVHY